MQHECGVPERVFAKHPQLKDKSILVIANEAGKLIDPEPSKEYMEVRGEAKTEQLKIPHEYHFITFELDDRSHSD